MSAIGKSGSDDVKSLKYSYEMREEQKEKMHDTQLKELQATHEKDMTRLSNASKEEVDKVRVEGHNRLTEQDQKYQREIESLKAMYQKKLSERDT